MNSIDTPALPETLTVAIAKAAVHLQNAKPEDVATILFLVREVWLEAVENGEDVDGFAVADSFPPLPDAAADAAVDTFLGEAWGDAIREMPILATFIAARPKWPITGMKVLSSEAGRAGDAYYDWQNDTSMALCAFLGISEGPPTPRYTAIMRALERAFEDGREAGGITDDPPRILHPVYQARISAARLAVVDRLPAAIDLDQLADNIRDQFEMEPADAWLAVEEVSRAASVDGDAHAARLRRKQILDVHFWFVDHADVLESRGTLTIATLAMADQSRAFLAAVAA